AQRKTVTLERAVGEGNQISGSQVLVVTLEGGHCCTAPRFATATIFIPESTSDCQCGKYGSETHKGLCCKDFTESTILSGGGGSGLNSGRTRFSFWAEPLDPLRLEDGRQRIRGRRTSTLPVSPSFRRT